MRMAIDRYLLRHCFRYTASMTDDSVLWTHKPAPRCRPRPGEQLWSMQKGDVTWSAELRYHLRMCLLSQQLAMVTFCLGMERSSTRWRSSGLKWSVRLPVQQSEGGGV